MAGPRRPVRRPGDGLARWLRAGRDRASLLAFGAPKPDPDVPAPETAEPPEAVLDFLRRLGVAMCEAGDDTDGITHMLDEVARAYGARGVRFFVLPTGVFARIDTGHSSRVDFAPGGDSVLRLDQVDALYRLIDDIRHARVDVTAASGRLDALLRSRPRFGALVTLLAAGVLTVGLGLMLNPTASAIPAYLVLGILVGALRWWADRDRVMALILSVSAAFAVTWVAFEVAAPLLDTPAIDLVIPSLVTLLPGAALTMATIELSGGSMISGSSRLVYGLQRLLLLTFGIAMGAELAGLPPSSDHSTPLGGWAPWVGVLIFGVGQYLSTSAPRHTLGWLLLVLYITYAIQASAGLLLGSLGASFVAGAIVLPVAYAVQRRPSGPPVLVTFLPAFWLLVPGALGLQGVAKIVGADQAAGLADFLNALLTIVAIAVGVLVGSGFVERVRGAVSRPSDT